MIICCALCAVQAIHRNAMQLIQKAEEMISNSHSETDQVRTLAEKVSEKWQKLMHHAQERHKLVMASNNWFKTADQVRFGALPRPLVCECVHRVQTCIHRALKFQPRLH